MEKPDQAVSESPFGKKLPRTVIVLGFVSFFNDFASDIVIPLIPILLATVLAAGPVALGLIEGVADAVASLLKLWAGRHSDVMSGRRKGLAVAGYTYRISPVRCWGWPGRGRWFWCCAASTGWARACAAHPVTRWLPMQRQPECMAMPLATIGQWTTAERLRAAGFSPREYEPARWDVPASPGQALRPVCSPIISF